MNAVQRDLAGWDGKAQRAQRVLHLNATTDVTFSVRQKRLFGQHSQLRICRRGRSPGPLRGEFAHQSGWQTPAGDLSGGKTGCRPRSLPQPFSAFTATLSELDYRRFSLTIDNQRWRCCIEPWAASEVVCKMPPPPLSAPRKHQRMLLLSVMNMLHQAIGQWMAQTATEK